MSDLKVAGPPMSKEDAVKTILSEMQRIILSALKDGHGQDMTPLELIASLTQQLCFEALKMDMAMDNTEVDTDEGGGDGTTH